MPRPTTPKLSRERIVDAALALYEAEGNFTIGSVARELEVRPSSLYNHVSGKSDILDAIRQRLHDDLASKVNVDADWQDALCAVARAQRDALARYPWAITMLAQSPAQLDGAITTVENLATVLVRSGFTADRALLVIGAIDVIAIGGAIDLTSPDELFPESVIGDAGELAHAVRRRGATGARANDTFEFLLNQFVQSVAPMRHTKL
ncbi:TetR/AcrR family transcriptional regulator [Streptomyces avermitilis]|uniref:TetR/AcrR family transcriptional regulator n=1 Tax=Streptomyces avermitilis TaxID=33903 RepID=UPI0038233DDF